jgi:DNA-binding XRE family transcriptional regulator
VTIGAMIEVRSQVELAAMRASLPRPTRRREIRLASGRSQANIAAAIGVTRIAVHQWESEGPSGTSPSDDHLPAYFAALVEMEQTEPSRH